jgi:hypothetical protein
VARPRTERRGLAWRVIDAHYRSRHAFQAIFRAYEQRVAKLVDQLGVPREEIKLNAAETRRLFDTALLNQLIERHVIPLRESAQACFRGQDVADPYDSEITQIFHELSILREEHLSVREFPHTAGRAFQRLFQEVSKYYPQRLRRVRDLFSRAQKRLDELLPGFRDDPIVLRSAFLFREELWPENPRGGLARFLGKVFAADGVATGFERVARSFLKAGFFEYAAEAARLGVAAAAKEAQARSSRAQQVREKIRELDRLASRADAERKALEEQFA